MKKLLILIFTIICCWSNSNAQTHNVLSAHCKFSKAKVDFEGQVCTVCRNNDKKEKDAKLAEDNRRAKVISDKYKADKIASDKAWKAKQLEDAKNAHSGEVLINGNLAPVKKLVADKNETGKTLLTSKKSNTSLKLYGKQTYNQGQQEALIINEKGDTILKSTEFNVYSWDYIISSYVFLNADIKEIPANIAIVRYNSNNAYNLINAKGEKLLSEENISGIRYCGNNFFMYFLGNETNFIENDYRLIGDKMILYDYELNKKYIYEKISDNANCKVNNRVQIGRKSSLQVSDYLFTFTQEKCTHTLKNIGGWMISDDANYKVGLDRKPILTGITHSDFNPHN